MENVVQLSQNVVIQRSVFTQSKPVALTELMNAVAASGKKMIVVENLATFFGVPNMIDAINKGDTETLSLVAEKQGIVIEEADLLAIFAFNRLKAKLVELASSKLPAYDFAHIPADWNVADNLNITKSSVSRRGVGETGYSIGLLTAKKVWMTASRFWAGEVNAPVAVRSISASGYNRDANITSKCVNIGCQTIQRFELEQLALHMSWPFPGSSSDEI